MIHRTFTAWMEDQVLPLGDQRRLDGRDAGGNREVAGRFLRYGTTWKVHADTHLEPLRLALEAERRGEDPFVIGQSKNGRTLELVERLQRRRGTRFKHLYVYEVG